jgi:serine/threonine-protein kinase
VNDSRVSRKQFRLVLERHKWFLEDLGSTNGTLVNNERVRRVELKEGDTIACGRVRLRFRVKEPEPVEGLPTTQKHEPARDRRAAASAAKRTREIEIPAASKGLADTARVVGERYEIGELIHRGSTGTFFKSRDLKDDRIVCVKILNPNVADDPKELGRFVRGVRTAAKLQHPNIVQLYRAGNSAGKWWLAMEYVDGPSLRQVVAKYGVGNMLAPARVLAIARDITAALEVAYEHQVLHRNIRPENILLAKSATAKLADFALVRGVVLSTMNRITGTSDLVGDLAYMAPERTEPDGEADCRSDIYSLGACLYSLLTGRPPFTGRGTVQMIDTVRNQMPTPPTRINLAVPGPLEGIVLKCLAKSPADRYQTPMELREDVARVGRFQGMWT